MAARFSASSRQFRDRLQARQRVELGKSAMRRAAAKLIPVARASFFPKLTLREPPGRLGVSA